MQSVLQALTNERRDCYVCERVSKKDRKAERDHDRGMSRIMGLLLAHILPGFHTYVWFF